MDPGVAVSVIVPFYNAEPYIDRCIRGLLAQDLPATQLEILMVDNNSSDRSADIVARYPQVQLLRESKQGAYAARNRALAQARGDVIAFTDPDCVPEPDWLSRLTAPLSNPEVQVVIGRSDPDSGSSALALLSAYEHQKDLYVFASDDPELYYGRTNNLATRRTTLLTYGPFVELMRGSDTIFVRQVVSGLGSRAVEYAPDARVLHLEIDSLGAYYAKVPLYGRSRAQFSHVVAKRTLTTRERRLIFRRTVLDRSVPLLSAVPLFGLLAAGVLAARFGSLTASRRVKSQGR